MARYVDATLTIVGRGWAGWVVWSGVGSEGGKNVLLPFLPTRSSRYNHFFLK